MSIHHEWYSVTTMCLSPENQARANRLEEFLQSERGRAGINLLAATGMQIVIVKIHERHESDYRQVQFILDGSGLQKIYYASYGLGAQPIPSPVSALMLFSAITRQPDYYECCCDPGDIENWLITQLNTIAAKARSKCEKFAAISV